MHSSYCETCGMRLRTIPESEVTKCCCCTTIDLQAELRGEEIAELKQQLAAANAEIARLKSYERDFKRGLGHMDRVFQKCVSNPNPVLPDYVPLGRCKFEAVERLATDYVSLQQQLAAAMSETARLMDIA